MTHAQAAIMEYCGFEGWLINIENSIDPADINALKEFLIALRICAKAKNPSAQVCTPTCIIFPTARGLQRSRR
jgi:hypothetical protein